MVSEVEKAMPAAIGSEINCRDKDDSLAAAVPLAQVVTEVITDASLDVYIYRRAASVVRDQAAYPGVIDGVADAER